MPVLVTLRYVSFRKHVSLQGTYLKKKKPLRFKCDRVLIREVDKNKTTNSERNAGFAGTLEIFFKKFWL